MGEIPRDVVLSRTEDALAPTGFRRVLWVSIGVLILLVALLALVWDVSIWSVGFGLLAGLTGGRLLSIGVRGVPLLEWDSRGVTDRTSLLGGEIFVPWEDISSVSVGRLRAAVRLNLIDHAESVRTAGPGRWLQAWINRMRGFNGIEISPSFMELDYRALGRSLDEMVTENQLAQVRDSLDAPALVPGGEGGSDPES